MRDQDLFLSVVKVITNAPPDVHTNATGFFYLHDDYLYLVTNRHVVLNEATNHRPESVTISLHTDAEKLSELGDISANLYRSGQPAWHEYQQSTTPADLVAIPITDGDVLSSHAIQPFKESDILKADSELPPDAEFLVVGYPLGFHDTLNGLPLVRKAIAASSFAHPFKGNPYFLTDARMHRGTSGSPVVIRTSPPHLNSESAWSLVGIHSAALDVSDRDPTQDERLGLNCTWYAWLLPEMIQSARSQS